MLRLCCCSGAKSCLTLYNSMNCSKPGFPVLCHTMGKKKNLPNKSCWESWISTYNRIELDSSYTTHRNNSTWKKKNNSAWIKKLKVRPETIKTLKRKHYGKALQHQSWQWFLGHDTESTGNKSENKQVVQFQTINNRVKR